MVGRPRRIVNREELQRGRGLRLEDVHARDRDLYYRRPGREREAAHALDDDAGGRHRHGRAVDHERAEVRLGLAAGLVKVAADPAHRPVAIDVDPQIELEAAQRAGVATADCLLDGRYGRDGQRGDRQGHLRGRRDARPRSNPGRSAGGPGVVRLGNPQVAIGQPGYFFIGHHAGVADGVFVCIIDPGWVEL